MKNKIQANKKQRREKETKKCGENPPHFLLEMKRKRVKC
jgi:hypothetical protein